MNYNPQTDSLTYTIIIIYYYCYHVDILHKVTSVTVILFGGGGGSSGMRPPSLLKDFELLMLTKTGVIITKASLSIVSLIACMVKMGLNAV